MIIYAEAVFISNFFIDLFLGVFSAAVLNKKIKTFRFILFALIGGAFSAVYPLLNGREFLLKLLLLPFLTAILCGVRDIKNYFALLVTVFTVTAISGGAVLFFIECNPLLSYEDFTYGWLPIIFSICFLGIIAGCSFLKKEKVKLRQKNGLIYNVSVGVEGEERKVKGYYDSGNRVYTDDGTPVVFVREKLFDSFGLLPLGSVEIITAGGIKSVPIAEAYIKIYFDSGENIIYKVALGRLNMPCEAEILLHSDMQGEGNAELV